MSLNGFLQNPAWRNHAKISYLRAWLPSNLDFIGTVFNKRVENDPGSVSSRELNDPPSPTWEKETIVQIEEIVAEQEDPFMKEIRDLSLAATQEEESDSEAWIQEMKEIRIARKRERKEEEDSLMGIVDRIQRTRRCGCL